MRLIGRHPVRRRIGMLAALTGCLLLAFIVLSGSAPGRGARASWVATWGLPVNAGAANGFEDQTIRIVLRADLGGSRVRIRLSNADGIQAVRLRDAHIGVGVDGAEVRDGTNVPLTFHGSSAITIPAGQDVISDPANLRVRDFETLVVSIYAPFATGPGTGDGELATYYTAAGNHAGDRAAAAFGSASSGGYFVTGVDVYTPNDGLIVAFGDSITAGWAADYKGWPYWLARRLNQLAAAGGPRLSVIDMGVSGNRVLSAGTFDEASAEQRLQRDVLAQTGLRGVLMMEGINDIGHAGPAGAPVSQLETAFSNIINRVHAAGASILLSPLTPAGDALNPTPYEAAYSDDAGVQARHAINAWIRSESGAYSPGFDLVPVIANRALPDELAAQYDSGDHLHPNLDGQRAMGNSIDLGTVERLATGPTPAVSPGPPAAPALRGLAVTPHVFSKQALDRRLVRARSASPIVSFSSDQPAEVTFTLLGRARGVPSAGRCVKPRVRPTANTPRCVHYVVLLRTRRRVRGGDNRLSLASVLGRPLLHGSYALRAVPSVDRLIGKAVTAQFVVVLAHKARRSPATA